MRHAHHALIRSLVAAVRAAREEAASAVDYAGYQEEAAIKASRRADREAADARRQEQDAEQRRYERESALHDLERARQRGDEYGEKRAISKMKRADW